MNEAVTKDEHECACKALMFVRKVHEANTRAKYFGAQLNVLKQGLEARRQAQALESLGNDAQRRSAVDSKKAKLFVFLQARHALQNAVHAAQRLEGQEIEGVSDADKATWVLDHSFDKIFVKDMHGFHTVWKDVQNLHLDEMRSAVDKAAAHLREHTCDYDMPESSWKKKIENPEDLKCIMKVADATIAQLKGAVVTRSVNELSKVPGSSKRLLVTLAF